MTASDCSQAGEIDAMFEIIVAATSRFPHIIRISAVEAMRTPKPPISTEIMGDIVTLRDDATDPIRHT